MAQQKIDGQKAGSGSSRQPVIAPDSASSVTKLKMAVGLSEGEIEGFTRADVKLDGTPLTELSSDIVCDYRFGANDQEYIPGIDEVANEIGVGVELRGDSDWVKLITNQDIDHVGIRLRWGPLQTSHSNGDITGVSIKYEVYIAPVGGSYERVLSTTLSDKTSDSYERYHEFKLPESDSGWMVRVVRVTPSARSSLVSDKMFVQAYSEIIKSKFTFPYTSLVYLEYDAKTFSNVAKVAVNAKGLIIKVPSNYDPVTRQYSGLWSGTFKMAYTNNPAWVYYDLVTNPRYGCGDRINSSMVDKWSLYKLGQYCDQMVDDGYGGLEPRFACNVYLQSKERAYDILNRLTGLFRAINFWNGSQLVVDADIPQDTSYLYTNANVVDGLFEYAGTAATDLYSAAKVAWDNPANGYNTEYEAVSYEHLVKKLGFKTLELDAWGCTSRGQALRAGRWALLAESDTVTFKVGMDGYLAMPGKIIEIQDEFYAGKSNGGRVISINQSRKVITLDRPVTTISGDTISFNTALDGIKKYNIVSSSGSVVTVSESIDPSIENMHIWAINSSQLATQKYRILTVKYDGVGEFTISAVEYNSNKYEEIDSNIKFDELPTSIINPVAQTAVQNVTITPSDFIYQGLNTVNLEIKWDRAENAVEYLVELKKDDGSWLKLPVTGNNSITLENVYAGAYIARVIAVSAFELKSLPTYSTKTQVNGKLLAPQPPTNLRSAPIVFGVEFYWDFPPNSSDTAVSRITVSYVEPGLGVDELTLPIYDKAYSDNKIVIQNLDFSSRVWVKVKLIDKLGFESPYTDWVSGQPSQDVGKVLNLISGHISESTLDQALQGKIDGAGILAGEAQTLANQANAAASNAQNIADQATIKAQEAANAVVQEAIDRATALTTQANTLKADSAAKVKALKDEVDPKITTLQNGITQVTTDYKAADTLVVGQLDAYKTSNDSAVASVLQKAESAVSTGSTNSSAITAINGQITALNGALSTKLDASVISNYYTKGQTDAKADEIAAGKIESYDANLVIGGVNLIPNSFDIPQWSNHSAIWPLDVDVVNGVRRVRRIGGTEPTVMSNYTGAFVDLPVGTAYTLSVKVRPIGSDYSLGFYGDDTSIKLCKADQWTTIQDTRTVINQPQRVMGLISYAVQEGVWVEVKEWQVEIGNKATSWSPSPADVQGAIDSNTNAIQTVNAEVSRVDGVATAANNATTALAGRVSVVEGAVSTKAEAAALTALTTRVSNAEGVNASQGTAITTLQNTVNNETTGLATKASTSALTATNSEVARVNGVVTGHTNQLTQLTSDITAINGTLATKLDSSAIVNYYTKQQADDKSAEIAAGKIESYDASLVIGAANLWAIEGSLAINELGATTRTLVSSVTDHYRYTLSNSTNWLMRNDNLLVSASGSEMEIGADYCVTFKVRANKSAPVLYYVYVGQVFHPKAGESVNLTTEWQTVSFAFKLNGANIVGAGQMLAINLRTHDGWIEGDWYEISEIMLQKGTKSTTWIKAVGLLNNEIKANANTIQTVNAEVVRVNGEVVATANNVNNLTSSVGLLQGSVNEVRQTVTNNQESTNTLVTSLRSGMADADDLSMLMRNATVVLEDLSFRYGYNGISLYNNYVNGALAYNFTSKQPDNPVVATRQLEFIHSGAADPALGGFRQAIQSRANGVFLMKFVAKLPVGYSFVLYANAIGDGASSYFIGGSEGTGKYKTYYGVYRCGAIGSFSTLGFVAINGSQPTPENPLIWYLASSTVYDCLDSKVAPDSVINGIAEAKSIASTAVTKADATAVLAQNLQASLDNTNANIATNYYTKSSTDQAIASASNQLSSSFNTAINNVGLINDTRYDNQPPSWYWTNYPHRTEKEFKNSYSIGISQATVDTLGVLETVSPWYDSSGGPIQQKFTWGDSAYALTRYSISNSEWSAWASALNEVKTAVDRKLDASIISNYYTKAEADNVVAGKVEQFSSSIAVGGANLWSVVNATRISEQGSHSITVQRADEEELWVTVNSLTNGASLIRFDSCLVDQNTQFIAGEDVVLSFEVSGSGYYRLGSVYAYVGNTGSAIFTPNIVTDPSVWQRVEYKFKASGVQVNGPSQLLGFSLNSADGWNTGAVLKLRHVQLQRGKTATAFSKAPAITRAAVRETTQTVNGIQAIKTVTIDNNGVMSGYGLISELKNGQVTSSFGINADTFYIGAPSGGRKMFVSTTTPQVINGVQYPAGTWIDVGNIANATIGIAHLNQATINHLMAGTVETVGADGARRVVSGGVDRLYAPNGALVLEIGLLS